MDNLEIGGLLDMYSTEELINELDRRERIEVIELDFNRGYSLLKDNVRRIVLVYTKLDKPTKKRKYIKY